MRGIDLLSDAVALARYQRHRHTVRQHDCAHLIGYSTGKVDRILDVGGTGVHDAGARLRQVIERRLAAVGTKRPVARRTRVNQLGVVRAQILVAQPQAVGHALAEVLDEDVALGDKLVDDLARPGLAQVEGEALLVAIVGLEIEVAGCFRSADRKNTAARIALLALLDLDDLGAHIGQHRCRDRPLLPDRPIDDPYAFKWCVHNAPYTTVCPDGLAPRIKFLRSEPLFRSGTVAVESVRSAWSIGDICNVRGITR